jgi:hypothetical protein
MAMTNSIRIALLNRLTAQQTTADSPLNIYIGVSSGASPAKDGTGVTEPTFTLGYSRQEIAVWDDAQQVADVADVLNTNEILFTEATGTWSGPLTYGVLWDHATNTSAANVLGYGSIGNITIGDGDQLRFQGGNIQITLS